MKRLVCALLLLVVFTSNTLAEGVQIKYVKMREAYVDIFTNDTGAIQSVHKYTKDQSARLIGYAEGTDNLLTGKLGSADNFKSQLKINKKTKINYKTFCITLNTVLSNLNADQIRKLYILLGNGWKEVDGISAAELSTAMLINDKDEVFQLNAFWILSNASGPKNRKWEPYTKFLASLFTADVDKAISAVNSVTDKEVKNASEDAKQKKIMLGYVKESKFSMLAKPEDIYRDISKNELGTNKPNSKELIENISETTWNFVETDFPDNTMVISFYQGGYFATRYPDGNIDGKESNAWTQNGKEIKWNMNNTASFIGTISGGSNGYSMSGYAFNKAGQKWNWKSRLQF